MTEEVEKFTTALANWPTTGTGQRLVHRHVLRLAALSRSAGLAPESAAPIIEAAMREYARPPHPGEIQEALAKGWELSLDGLAGTKHGCKSNPPLALETYFSYAEEGAAMGFGEADLRTPSPERMPGSEGAVPISWESGWMDAAALIVLDIDNNTP